MHNIINTSSGQSWSSKVNSPLPEVEGGPGARGYTGGFQTKLMLKVGEARGTRRHPRQRVTRGCCRWRCRVTQWAIAGGAIVQAETQHTR